MYKKYGDASSALLFITVLLIRQYFFNLPTLPSLCSQCGHQQEETRLLVDPLHRASYISVLHFLRMFPYRASLYLHSQLISYTSAKHYGDEKCSCILLTMERQKHERCIIESIGVLIFTSYASDASMHDDSISIHSGDSQRLL